MVQKTRLQQKKLREIRQKMEDKIAKYKMDEAN